METIQQQIYTNLALARLKPGHHTRDRTAGIDGAAQARFEEVCNRWGVYEPGTDFHRALVQIPLWDDAPPPAPPSHMLLVLHSNKGRDAQGRLGAVLRHVVKIPADQYARLEHHPFRLLEQGQLLEDWSPSTPLADLVLRPHATTTSELQAIFPERYPLLRVLLARLLGDGTAHIPVDSDSAAIEEIFDQAVTLMPLDCRRRLSLATYTFNNPQDYHLAAYHQRDARVRQTLEALESGPAPAVSGDVSAYLDRLFASLQAEDWGQALALIRQTSLPPSGRPHPLAVTATAPPPDTATSPVTPPPPASPPPKAPPEPAHHPHWQRQEGGGNGGGRGRWWLALIVVAVLGVAGWLLLGRGELGNASSRETPTTTRLVDLSADGLEPFLERHELLLGSLLLDDVRDLDLRSAMVAAAPTLAVRAGQALKADVQRLDRQLTGQPGDAARDLGQVTALVSDLARATTANLQRLTTLDHVLAQADADLLRPGLQADEPRVRLSQLSPADATDGMAGLARAATALSDLAAALEAMAALDHGALPAWSSLDTDLGQAVAGLPAMVGEPPLVIRRYREAVAAYVALRQAEQAANLAGQSAAVPYSSRWLERGQLADAARAFDGAIANLTGFQSPVPAPLARAAALYRLGREERLRSPAALDPDQATALLTELAVACGPAATLPCGDPLHGALIARWQLEAWRAVGGPESRQGRLVQESAGQAAIPGGDARVAAVMVDLVDRMAAAGTPAAGALLDDVSAQSRRLAPGLFRDICTGWQARVERRSVGQQATFQQLYARLQKGLDRLRGADDEAGPAAFASLQGVADELMDLDLATLAADPALAGRVQAVRDLRRALMSRRLVQLTRLDLELRRREDYAGNRKQEIRPSIRIGTVRGTRENGLFEYQAPPVIAGGSAGFEPFSLKIDGFIPLTATDTVLITVRDADGGMWLHYYFDPPQPGHVVATMTGLHEVRASAEARRAVVDRPDAVPPRGNQGDLIAMIRIVVQPGFWSGVGRDCPDLP